MTTEPLPPDAPPKPVDPGTIEADAEESPATARAIQTAARLRKAAREAFGELGWQATRVQDVVERAGVSHGTFYTYYENKAAVLADLVRESQADLEALAEARWEAENVRGALEGIIGGLLEVYERDLPVLRTWLEATRDEPEFREPYVQIRARYRDRVADQVQAVIDASGRTAAAPATTIASALVAMVEHVAYSWFILGEPHERQDVLDTLVLVWGSTLNSLAGFEVVSF